MGALYGFREEDLIDGVKAFNPLDVLDSALTAWRAGAFQLNTWTVLPRLQQGPAGSRGTTPPCPPEASPGMLRRAW